MKSGLTIQKKFSTVLLALGMFIVLFCVNSNHAFAQTTGTVSAASANIRASASTSSQIIASVVKGDVVSIADEVTDANGVLWYQIHVDATTKGYIAASLVIKDGDSAPATSTTPTTSTTNTTTTDTSTIAPESEWKYATIVSDSVRVRESATTTSDIIATVTKGVILQVTGSTDGTTDSYEWYQVKFEVDGTDYIGYIRSDLLTFDSDEDGDTTQVEGTLDPNEGAVDGADNTETTTEETTDTESTQETTKTGYTVIEPATDVRVPDGYMEVAVATDSGDVKGYKNGEFYILYVVTSDGTEGWYRYDSIQYVYQRYIESESMSTDNANNSQSANLLVYILIGVIAILVIIVVILILRLLDMRADLQYGEDDYYGDSYPEDRYEEENYEGAPYEEEPYEEAYYEDDLYEESSDDSYVEEPAKEDMYNKNRAYVNNYVKKDEEHLKPDEDDLWDDELDIIDLD